MEKEKSNKGLIGVLIVVVVLQFFALCYLLFGKDLLNKNTSGNSTTNTTNNKIVDYSNEIISHWWCINSKGFGGTDCLEFEEGMIRYGEPGSDAGIDGVSMDKILKISDDLYEIYGIDGKDCISGCDEDATDEEWTYYTYNIVWKIRYNATDDTITILEGKRTYPNGEKPDEVVSTYNNLKLYKRNYSDFYN